MLDFFSEKDITSEAVFVPGRPPPAHTPQARRGTAKGTGKGTGRALNWLRMSIVEYEQWAREQQDGGIDIFEKRSSPVDFDPATRAEQRADEKQRRRMMKYVLVFGAVVLVITAIGVGIAAATAQNGHNSIVAGAVTSATASYPIQSTTMPSTAVEVSTASDMQQTAASTVTTSPTTGDTASTEAQSYISPPTPTTATDDVATSSILATSTVTTTTSSYSSWIIVTDTSSYSYWVITTASPMYFFPSGTTGTAPFPSSFFHRRTTGSS